jgi:hypothetical protein
MLQSHTLSMGMDVQTDALAIASVSQDHHAEVSSLGAMGTRHGDSDQLSRHMPSTSQQLGFVSAAGPCGDGLSRSLTKKGHVCWGVAPSLRPTKAGNRVQTTRRDARQVARLRRSGALQAGRPGDQPPCAGAVRASVPPPRSPWSSTQIAGQ